MEVNRTLKNLGAIVFSLTNICSQKSLYGILAQMTPMFGGDTGYIASSPSSSPRSRDTVSSARSLRGCLFATGNVLAPEPGLHLTLDNCSPLSHGLLGHNVLLGEKRGCVPTMRKKTQEQQQTGEGQSGDGISETWGRARQAVRSNTFYN